MYSVSFSESTSPRTRRQVPTQPHSARMTNRSCAEGVQYVAAINSKNRVGTELSVVTTHVMMSSARPP